MAAKPTSNMIKVVNKQGSTSNMQRDSFLRQKPEADGSRKGWWPADDANAPIAAKSVNAGPDNVNLPPELKVFGKGKQQKMIPENEVEFLIQKAVENYKLQNPAATLEVTENSAESNEAGQVRILSQYIIENYSEFIKPEEADNTDGSLAPVVISILRSQAAKVAELDEHLKSRLDDLAKAENRLADLIRQIKEHGASIVEPGDLQPGKSVSIEWLTDDTRGAAEGDNVRNINPGDNTGPAIDQGKVKNIVDGSTPGKQSEPTDPSKGTGNIGAPNTGKESGNKKK